ncbi:DUF1298 domain-containing protein [Mycobacterium sp. MMS18-G62]
MPAKTALPATVVHPRGMPSRMTPVDAMWYWFATKFRTDQFLVYAFAGTADIDAAVAEILDRADASLDLKLRIAPRRWDLTFPRWRIGDVESDQVVVHSLPEPTWPAFLQALSPLIDDQLDPRSAAWRLHVYPGLSQVPATPGEATVVVLQVAHPLGDGMRSSALAGYLFGRNKPLPETRWRRTGGLAARMIERTAQQRRLARDVEAGRIQPKSGLVPALSTNNIPTGTRLLRTLAMSESKIAAPTVTIGVLAAISEALSGYLTARGEDASRLAAEVLMAKPGMRYSYNHFDAVGVGLHSAATSRGERIRLIAGELQACRTYREHPAVVAGERVFEAVPGPLRRWGVKRLNPNARPEMVRGNTGVSSVHRGPADLQFGGCPVTLTCGYPALSSVLGLTHGVHGIGDTIAISVNTTSSIIGDFDEYMDRLAVALR